MADPVSVFPIFVRNQAFPPTSATIVVSGIQAQVSSAVVSATIDDPAIQVTVTPASIIAGS